ncbi:LysR family transcriptional regulator [Mycolicibacillus trivialis]|uniref:Probable hydrogen peroxide-inducible genes activator n=1 Tax=Mycolicibacillus trivialis TaxID=1798 RepID=A0A1X2EIT6_9MYCO|nr:LysR family transcriptional regulator [Mycolicibacillus trivialis]ORX03379.1 transcriptional regulator [Mycolicibacillus trivialis]
MATALPSGAPDLRRLGYFVAVAEAGGFTAAATRLHLSQQALSSAIRQLEKEIGADLLARSGRRVSLTDAGRTLFDEGRILLAAADTVARHTRAAAAPPPDTFLIGHSPAISSADVYTLLAPTIASFPDTSFTVMQLFPDRLIDGVHDGSLQLGLRRGVAAQERLATATAGYDRMRVALRSEHPLAGRALIDVADLADTPIALWAPPGSSFYSDFLVNACRRAGFEPRYRVSRVQGCPPEAAALTENAAAFVTGPAGSALDGAVTVVDLAGPLLVPVQALWQPHTRSAVRDRILHQPVTGGTPPPPR